MTQKWFERSFQPLNDELYLPGIIERLAGTPVRLRHLLAQIPEELYTQQYEGTWSIQENAGHLLDLEPLWIGRIRDFVNGEEVLRPADLSNKKTFQARHNEASINTILDAFEKQRSALVKGLQALSDRQLARTALHPRLETPMLPSDLAYFAAEHDDHHLARIRYIWKSL